MSEYTQSEKDAASAALNETRQEIATWINSATDKLSDRYKNRLNELYEKRDKYFSIVNSR